MYVSDALGVFSQVINILIFIYFALTLIEMNVLEVGGLLVSVFGLFASVIVSIISVLERKRIVFGSV